MKKVFVLKGKRSCIGTVNGFYKNIPAEILGSEVLKELLQETEEMFPKSEIDFLVCGNATAGGNIGRLLSLESGLDVPSFTVDSQCASSLEAADIAAEKIMCGKADCIIAGGSESASTIPLRRLNANHPEYDYDDENKNFYTVAKFSPGFYDEYAMFRGAENVAGKYKFSRAFLNKYILRSHMNSSEAYNENRLKNILCCSDFFRSLNANCDEGVRQKISEKFLNRLPCVFGETVTPASCSLKNDGAAFMVLCSEDFIEKYNLKPMAEILDSAFISADPDYSPESSCTVISRLLEQNNLNEKDVSIYEVNESFAVIGACFEKQFGNIFDCYNISGSALSYGHPYGASGAVLVLHAIENLGYKNKGDLAVASVPAAGGIGKAMLVRKV